MADVAIPLAVGVRITLEVDGRAVSLSDPSDGSFDAAGDIDRLIPFPDTWWTLSRIDPYGLVEFTPLEMATLADEAAAVLDQAREGAERRGTLRLRALASHGSQIPGSVLRAIGDWPCAHRQITSLENERHRGYDRMFGQRPAMIGGWLTRLLQLRTSAPS
jgi:hypothetical protein